MAIEINGDTGISGVNGSATTPAIQGTDTNTGLSFGTDEVNIVTGGSTRVTVDSSGRLGIGTTSPVAELEVQAAATPEVMVRNTTTSSFSSLHLAEVGDSSGTFVVNRLGSTSTASGGARAGQIWNSANAPIVFGTNGTERMRIRDDGLVFINTTTKRTNAFLAVKSTSGETILSERTGTGGETHIQFYNANDLVGSISTSGSSTSYNTSSDYRLKENVIPLTGAADRLNQLQVRRFNFIADPDTTVDGFIAHEAQAVVPEAVTGTQDEVEVWKEGEELPDGVSVGDNKLDEDGNTIPVYQGIDQSKLVPLLTAALQEALAKIETFETRLTALEGGAS